MRGCKPLARGLARRPCGTAAIGAFARFGPPLPPSHPTPLVLTPVLLSAGCSSAWRRCRPPCSMWSWCLPSQSSAPYSQQRRPRAGSCPVSARAACCTGAHRRGSGPARRLAAWAACCMEARCWGSVLHGGSLLGQHDACCGAPAVGPHLRSHTCGASTRINACMCSSMGCWRCVRPHARPLPSPPPPLPTCPTPKPLWLGARACSRREENHTIPC